MSWVQKLKLTSCLACDSHQPTQSCITYVASKKFDNRFWLSIVFSVDQSGSGEQTTNNSFSDSLHIGYLQPVRIYFSFPTWAEENSHHANTVYSFFFFNYIWMIWHFLGLSELTTYQAHENYQVEVIVLKWFKYPKFIGIQVQSTSLKAGDLDAAVISS